MAQQDSPRAAAPAANGHATRTDNLPMPRRSDMLPALRAPAHLPMVRSPALPERHRDRLPELARRDSG